MPAPNLKPLIAAALVACLLASATAPALAKDETTPLTVDASFNAATAASKGFTVLESKVLKGIQRVAVPVFAVEFVVADSVSSTSSGFGGGGRSTNALYYKMQGAAEADYQAITDAVYLQFLADLKASGVEVLDAAQIVAAPTYRKLVATGRPAPVRTDSTLMLSPPGLGIYGFAGMGGGNSAKSKSVFGALSDIGAGFSAVGAITDTIQLATELDASLIEVRMRVSFVQLSDDSRGFLGRIAGQAAVSGKSSPSIDNVMVGVQSGPLRSTLTMKHTLTLDPAAFAEVREKATTKADIAGAIGVGLLKLALGSKDSFDSKELEVVADPIKYREVVGGGLTNVGQMVVARLASER